jgi:hypothetical protein
VAEDVERMKVTRVEGVPDRSGVYTIVGIILGVLLIAGVAFAIIGVPKVEEWWGSDQASNSRGNRAGSLHQHDDITVIGDNDDDSIAPLQPFGYTGVPYVLSRCCD